MLVPAAMRLQFSMNSVDLEAIPDSAPPRRHLSRQTPSDRPYSRGSSPDGRRCLGRVPASRSAAFYWAWSGWKAFHVDGLADVVDIEIPFVANQTEYKAGGRSREPDRGSTAACRRRRRRDPRACRSRVP